MQFDLFSPWDAWRVKTQRGKHTIIAKIDTGASLTLVGIKHAKVLGLDVSFNINQPCVNYSGVSGKADGYAFKVSCDSLPLGNEQLICPFVYVPFEYVVDEHGKNDKIRFITADKYLIGTDILNHYNMDVSFIKKISNKISEVKLTLTAHGLSYDPAIMKKDLTFRKLFPQINELELD